MQPLAAPPIRSRRQRLLATTSGFVLLGVGVPMLFLPGPGAPAIVLGLRLLSREYVWAERLGQRVQGVMRPGQKFWQRTRRLLTRAPGSKPAPDGSDQTVR